MLNLNLLPPEEKLNLIRVFRRRAVVAVGGGLTAVFAIFSILLLPTIFMLAAEKSELLRAVRIERDTQEKTGANQQAADVKKVNLLAEKILEYDKKQRKIFTLFEAIIKETPSSIKIEHILLRNTSEEIAISGFSGTREDLLKFLDAMDKNPYIEKVSSPVTNLVKERNVRFSLTAKLK